MTDVGMDFSTNFSSKMLRSLIIVQLFAVLAIALPINEDFDDEKYVKMLTEIRVKSSGNPDYSLGKKLEQWTPDSKVNPEELGSYFEGDILHDPLQDRNGIIPKHYRWPNAEVPYVIDKQFNSRERGMIAQAMEAYHANTCIKFRPYENGERDYVSIEKSGAGCFSDVGRIGGVQVVNLQASCLTRIGVPIHELMHALGFFHEQSRMERDKYVKILWENIEPGKEGNFEKRTSTAFGIKYDYGSVMHYSATTFSINGLATIVPKKPNVSIGQRDGLSESDIAKINIMYKC